MSRFMASINFNKQTEINVVDIQLATIDSGLSEPEIHVQGQNCQASIKSNKQTEIRGPVLTGKILGSSAGPELQKVWKSWTVRIRTLVKPRRSRIFKFSAILARPEVSNCSRSDLSFSQTGPRISVCLLDFMDANLAQSMDFWFGQSTI